MLEFAFANHFVFSHRDFAECTGCLAPTIYMVHKPANFLSTTMVRSERRLQGRLTYA